MKKLIAIFLIILTPSIVWGGNVLRVVNDCEDTFTADNGSAPDAIKWTESDISSCMSIQGNTLYFTYTGDALVGAYVLSLFHFKAGQPFDIQLDFTEDHAAPDAGTVFCPQIQIQNGAVSVYSHITRYINSTPVDQYFCQGSTTGWDGSIPTGNASGKIRFVMASNILKGYVWDTGDSRWEWDDNVAGKTFGEDYTGEDVYIKIFFNHPNTTGASSMTGTVDNFVINDGRCYY